MCLTNVDFVEPSKSLLRPLRIGSQQILTPKARYLYKRGRKLQSALGVYKKRTVSLRKRLFAAQKFDSTFFDPRRTALSQKTIKFCLEQLHKAPRKPKGQRYSLDEKLLSVALFKTSGTAYRFLSKWFCLPSKKTLFRLLSKIEIKEDINSFLMDNIEKSATKLKERERYCMLLFDEMSLMPNISYDKYEDSIVGIVDGKIVDHALVFMVRGVTRKWKQTVAYSFCKGSSKPQHLQMMIKSLVRGLRKAGMFFKILYSFIILTLTMYLIQLLGLNIVAVVCDQSSTNRSAVEGLVAEAKALYIHRGEEPRRRILVDGKAVIPLYDIPHLIKGIRNLLLQRNLVWINSNEIITARWRDIEAAYHIDRSAGDLLRCLPRITEKHIVQGKMNKMKVSCATQVLSHSMAAAISIMARNG